MTPPASGTDLVTSTPLRLHPDPGRVYADLFMPGEEMPDDHSRATAVIDRVLALSAEDVAAGLSELVAHFAGRIGLQASFQQSYDTAAHRLGRRAEPDAQRKLLIGAYFTHDVAPEGAALTNPSMVPHPDQGGLPTDALRFVMSVRAIGEGHISSMELRTGVVGGDATVQLDPLSGCLETPGRCEATYERAAFWAQLHDLGSAGDTALLVLEPLGTTFDRGALEASIGRLDSQLLSREASRDAVTRLRWIADNTYEVGFRPTTALSERVLVPTGPSESNGIEDVRLVRFTGDDGAATYFGTYTAYDGRRVTPQVLRTADFQTFTAGPLCGPAAQNKGMALFPRLIDGRRASLSRWDRERSFLAWSDDGTSWGDATAIQAPSQPWDLIQVGNCGSPLETAEGWVVLTHGVGPMRTYTIGAMLLDLDDPTRVRATLPGPLIVPADDERAGYVPNVVYSCGGLIHGDRIVVPYGVGDQTIRVAMVDLPGLLQRFV